MSEPITARVSKSSGIKDSTDSQIILGLFLGAILAAIAILIFSTVKSDHSSWIVSFFLYVIFGGVPVPCFALAVLMARHKRKFGTARLFLDELPAVLGATMNGKIELPKPLQGFKQIELRMICTRSRPSSNFYITREVGRVVSVVRAAGVSISNDSMSIPLNMAIPDSLPVNKPTMFGPVIEWNLEVEALPKKRRGLFYDHFSTSFRVPVVNRKVDLVKV